MRRPTPTVLESIERRAATLQPGRARSLDISAPLVFERRGLLQPHQSAVWISRLAWLSSAPHLDLHCSFNIHRAKRLRCSRFTAWRYPQHGDPMDLWLNSIASWAERSGTDITWDLGHEFYGEVSRLNVFYLSTRDRWSCFLRNRRNAHLPDVSHRN